MVFGYVNLWSTFGTKGSDYVAYQSYFSTRSARAITHSVYASRSLMIRNIVHFKARTEYSAKSYEGTGGGSHSGSYCQS